VLQPRADQRIGVGEGRRRGQAQADQVAADLVAGVARDRDPVRCLVKVPAGQVTPLRVLLSARMHRDGVGVSRPHRVDPDGDAVAPAEAPAQQRVVHQVGHVDHQRLLAAEGPPVQVVSDPAADVALQIGVPQPQVG
jgi:hypothetical protein